MLKSQHEEGTRIFDEDVKLEKISRLGNQLEKLNKAVDWEQFRSILVEAFEKESKRPGGRPSFDRILRIKADYGLLRHICFCS